MHEILNIIITVIYNITTLYIYIKMLPPEHNSTSVRANHNWNI